MCSNFFHLFLTVQVVCLGHILHTYSPFSSFSMFAGLLLTRLADLPTAGILEDITLGGWFVGSLVTVKVIY